MDDELVIARLCIFLVRNLSRTLFRWFPWKGWRRACRFGWLSSAASPAFGLHLRPRRPSTASNPTSAAATSTPSSRDLCDKKWQLGGLTMLTSVNPEIDVTRQISQTLDVFLADCPRICIWIISLIPEAILFKFGPFLKNSTRVWRTDGRTLS